MTRLTFFFAFLFCSLLEITAQVTAGVLDHLAVNNANPAETINLFTTAPAFGQFDNEASDSLDLNRDGKYDVVFNCSACNTFDCNGGTTTLGNMHAALAFMVDSNHFVRQLSAGDAIDAAQSWEAVSGILIQKVYGIGGYIQSGNWFPALDGYAGIRLVVGSDTLYGWLKIRAAAATDFGSASIQVLQWAIEEAASAPPSLDFALAGASVNLVPGQQTIQLQQVSIPFPSPTPAAKVDSLDLNRDGIYDVSFQVNLCNTFNCLQSSTSCLGMHQGFNFVRGAADTKRFEAGDTISARANWNAASTPYKVGLLTALAVGGQGAGEWLNDSIGYLGFRLVTPAGDTLLGWIHLYTYSLANKGAYLEVLGWAIEHDPAQKPYAATTVTPAKMTYCPGDTVRLEANTAGTEQVTWHFWDGTTDTSTTSVRVLPDSTVVITLEAANANGTTVISQTLLVSPLVLTVPDIVLTCLHPADTLSAATNIPAIIWWVNGQDTIQSPIPPSLNWSFPIVVIAQDEYGCLAVEQLEIIKDMNAPAVTIEYDESRHLLIAQASTSGVVFQWTSDNAPEPAYGDSLFIALSGTYTLLATGTNGCTTEATITVMVTGSYEPASGLIHIHPNPVNDFLQIENHSPSAWRWQVFDAAGCLKRTLGEVVASCTLQLDLTVLPGGSYWLVGYGVGDQPLIFKRLVKI